MALIGELDEARVEFKRRADIPSATYSAKLYARGRADGLWQAITAIGGDAGLPGKWDALAVRLAGANAALERMRAERDDAVSANERLFADNRELAAFLKEAKRDAG